MDIVSLLSTQLPGYFILGPLAILLITLIVLSVKKSSPAVSPVVQAISQAKTVAQAPASPLDASPFLTDAKKESPLPPVKDIVPVSQMTAPAPETVTRTQVSDILVKPTEPAVVPPVSSWKPAEPATVIVEEPVVVPEVAEVTPVIHAPVVEQAAEVAQAMPEEMPAPTEEKAPVVEATPVSL